MSALNLLADLATLVSEPLPPEEAIRRSLPLLQQGLGARDVRLVYGWHDGFRSLGATPGDDLSDIALWLVNRDLTSRRSPVAFDVQDGRVKNFRSACEQQLCEQVAALLPVRTTSDMVVASGRWPNGLSKTHHNFLRVSLPALGLLMERWLEGNRAERQQEQLSALANIPRIVSESDNLDTVLTAIARTIASVSGVNYVSIDVLGPDGKVSMRAVNGPDRPGTDALTERWKRAAQRPDPARDEVIRTRKPLLFHDAQNDNRLPESSQAYFSRTLIRSTALFPLLAKSEVLGVLGVASHQPLEFSGANVELLEAMSAQVASAVNGIQLYRELADSREQLQRLNQQLRETMGIEHHLARTDSLTGIPNRRFIEETLESEHLRAVRYGQKLSVVLADLDNLKQINDTLSHEAGDEVLQYIANRARELCRGVDVVGRYAGDEFLFILPSTGLDDAAAFGERFRRTVAERPILLRAGRQVETSVSIGVAEWRESMSGPADLIRESDRAMYRAKAEGRNRTVSSAGDGPVRAA